MPVDIAEPSACYGSGSSYQRDHTTGERKHRQALEAKLGRPLLPGMEACHSCDNKWCVNEDHLWEGTHADNMADARAKGVSHDPPHPTGEAHHSSKLREGDVSEMRRLHAHGLGTPTLARLFGVRKSTAWKVVTRRTWANVAD